MLYNYLKILVRNLIRSKTFSAINILGLGIGFTCTLMIGLYVADEFSFDRHHEKTDRIYMAITQATWAGETRRWNGLPNKAATAIAEIPEVEKAVRFFNHAFGNLAFVSSDSVQSSEAHMAWADPEIFDVLSYTFLKGDPATVLARPNTVVISETAAKKYFGNQDPIGKTLLVDNTSRLEVTGIFQDPPHASRFQHPLIATFQSNFFGQADKQSWGNASFETYVLLHPDADPAVVEQKIEEMLARSIPKDDRWFTLSLKPLKDAYIYSKDYQDFSQQGARKGDIGQIRILIVLGGIILLIASVNYMNLSTAQSRRRFKEIGISKTLGATGSQLARKFYLETSVVVLLSMIIGVVLTTLLLPFFNDVTGKFINLYFLTNGPFWASFVFCWIILGLVSGIYPALYLSSFSAGKVLKINIAGVGGNASLRKILVVMQFSISIILIISTVILYQQMMYIQNKNLGYKPEQVVAVLTSGATNRDQVLSFKGEADQLLSVLATARSQTFPGEGGSGRSLPPLNDDQADGMALQTVRATAEIIDVLGIPLLAGKSIPENKAAEDTTIQILLNKTSVQFLGITPEEAVNRIIKVNGFGRVQITGVMDDFHFKSLHERIGAYCFHNARTETYNYLLVKVQTNDLHTTMKQLEEKYRKAIPGAFEYTFLDQKLDTLYKEDRRLANVILLFAVLAISIACLGLYALASFTTEQRTKEIGIRKVLGASVGQLTGMLSGDFIRLVLISFVVAAPLGYLLMEEWLKEFAYRVDVSLWIIVLAGVTSVVIAWLTVSFESVKAALANPVNSLRNE